MSSQLFDVLLHIELDTGDDQEKLVPKIKYKFPDRSEKGLESIVQFCFPDVDIIRAESKMQSQTFSFVLTEVSGERRFGYCRRLLPKGSGKRLPQCFCITSFFPCFSVFSAILDEVELRWRGPSFKAVTFFVEAILQERFPEPGQALTVSVCSWDKPGQVDDHSFLRPSDSDSMLDHVSLEPLLLALDTHNLLLLLGSLLVERRVIFVSANLSQLSACVQAAVALLYPFSWQHVYIPVLPSTLLAYCCAPMPFVVGVLETSLLELSELPLEETLIVDLDENKFLRYPDPEAPEQDMDALDAFHLAPVVSALTDARLSCGGRKGKTQALTPAEKGRLTSAVLKF
ncbi:MAG: DENN domain-containing protein, partial [archaeon]|nr:DENN domain-containing protein [archaeon]